MSRSGAFQLCKLAACSEFSGGVCVRTTAVYLLIEIEEISICRDRKGGVR